MKRKCGVRFLASRCPACYTNLIADGGVVVCPSPSCDGFTPMFECPLGKCSSCAHFLKGECGGVSEELQERRDSGVEVRVDIDLLSGQKLKGVVTLDALEVKTILQCLRYGAEGFASHIPDDNGYKHRMELVEKAQRKVANIMWEIGGALIKEWEAQGGED